MGVWQIFNATYIDSNSLIKDFEFYVKKDKISFSSINTDLKINIHGRVILPSFINSFDNLLATYLPYKGENFPYYTWLMWDNELKKSKLFEERLLLDREDLYFLGTYRNILSGVLFVVDPIPKFVFEDLIPELDIDILEDFGISHSPVSYSLNWGKGIKEEYTYAVQNNLPFIIRVGEGFDSENKNSIKILEEWKVLSKNTVLVHGISISNDDIKTIKKYECSLVWCPEVNELIFGKTTNITKVLEEEIRVCLGSGSAMHGSENLLSTIKVAKKYIKDPKLILKMILDNPVESFFLKEKKAIKEQSTASFILLDIISPKTYDFIWNIDLRDIILVVHRGMPLYGSFEFKPLFDLLNVPYEEIKIKKNLRIIKKHFTSKLNQIFFKLGKEVSFPFLPITE